MYAYAASSKATCVAQGFLTKINEEVFFPLITLLMAIAFLYFLYGGFNFIKNANNPAGREVGKKHMIYGIIGLLVMISAYTILSIAGNSFGVNIEDISC